LCFLLLALLIYSDLAADLSPAGGKKRTRRNNHTPTHPATTPPGTIR